MEELVVKEILNEEGKKVGETEYLNGKPHGLCRLWSPDGVLILSARMSNGEYHGKYQSWWNNGIPKEEGEFIEGKRAGVYRWYKEDGSLWQERTYE